MNGMVLLFLVTALGTLISALWVVTARKMVHAALWLVVALFGGAIIFVLLNAAFLAVVQVVIYIGAIAVLLIFAVMLTRESGEREVPRANESWPIAAALCLTLFVGLTFFYLQMDEVNVFAPPLEPGFNMIMKLGQQLVSPHAYVLPFELASILLLAALIGSILIARRE